MPAARPVHRQPFKWRHLIRLLFAAALTAFAVGYVVSDLDGTAAAWLPRVGLSVAAVLLIVWGTEIRVSRQLARNEAHLAERLTRIELKLQPQPAPRPEYWQIYSDVLADLSGIGTTDGGDSSTDSGRLPHRD